ncbi:MAG: histidine--tRNA ligase [Planctomycetota bacterium]
MEQQNPTPRVIPRRLKGFRDILAGDVTLRDQMISRIREVYERYGFVPLETPLLEYVDVLGKFLPEADQPDGGIFAFRDEDQEWVGLRYDLTAPLSRFVAMNPQLPLPFRRYQVGPVFRVDKPGPGRYREFFQFDVDSVGTASMLADAEICMVMCDTMESLGIAPGDFLVRVNNRKVLNGVIERVEAMAALAPRADVHILRTVDKLDRVGLEGVQQLLGPGRKDESGDFTKGVGLSANQIDVVMGYLSIQVNSRSRVCEELHRLIGGTKIGDEGISELKQIDEGLTSAGYDNDRVSFDPTVVRGLAYYTGPVFETVLTFKAVDDEGVLRQFGSVSGGGRYDGLVERFTGTKIPATGASIGVDRLLAALKSLDKVNIAPTTAPVLITRLDPRFLSEYHRMATELRSAGVHTEVYVGTQGIGKQFKYASDSGKTVAIIFGEDEAKAGTVAIKDLRLGQELSENIGGDRRKWLEEQPAQIMVPRAQLRETVRGVLARYLIG